MLIIHGDNTLNSGKEISFIKSQNKNKELVILNGGKVELTELKGAIEAKSFFENEKLIILENFLSKVKSLKIKNQELNYLLSLKENDARNLILWEGKEINKSLLSKFKIAKIKIYKIEKIIFSLVESLKPGNNRFSLNLLRQVLYHNPIEIIFIMLIRQIRFLILIKSETKTGPADFQRLLPWQKERLTNQAKFFTMEKLKQIYQELLEIDYKNKTGRNVFSLNKTIELLLSGI